MMQRILDFCVAQHDWLMHTLETLVRLESPSHDMDALDRCAAELERRLRAAGGRVDRFGRNGAALHLRADFGSTSPQVLVLTHFDTVWPVGQLDRMPVRREGERLYGPGVYDMKAGIVLALLAIRALLAGDSALLPHVVLLLTSDEEVGSATSRPFIEEEAARSEAVLVLEPSMPDTGALKTARKGAAAFEVRVRGVAAHAGEPHKGVNAVLELADQLLAIDRLQGGRPGVTITTCMAGGGARTNVVPDEAWALLDVRMPALADAHAIEHALRGLQPRREGAQIAVSGGVERPPLERTPAVARLFEMAREIGSDIGLDVSEAASGGVSDGNFTAALGVPTLDGLGAVGGGAHALDEHVDVPALAPRAALLAGLLTRFARSGS